MIDTTKPLQAERLSDGVVFPATLQGDEGEEKFPLRVRIDGDCHTGSRWFTRDGMHIRGKYVLSNTSEPTPVVPEVDTTKPVQFLDCGLWRDTVGVHALPDGSGYYGAVRSGDKWFVWERSPKGVRNKPPEPTVIESKLFVNINQRGAYGYSTEDAARNAAEGGKYLAVAFPLSHRFTVGADGAVVVEIVEGGGTT